MESEEKFENVTPRHSYFSTQRGYTESKPIGTLYSRYFPSAKYLALTHAEIYEAISLIRQKTTETHSGPMENVKEYNEKSRPCWASTVLLRESLNTTKPSSNIQMLPLALPSTILSL